MPAVLLQKKIVLLQQKQNACWHPEGSGNRMEKEEAGKFHFLVFLLIRNKIMKSDCFSNSDYCFYDIFFLKVLGNFIFRIHALLIQSFKMAFLYPK